MNKHPILIVPRTDSAYSTPPSVRMITDQPNQDTGSERWWHHSDAVTPFVNGDYLWESGRCGHLACGVLTIWWWTLEFLFANLFQQDLLVPYLSSSVKEFPPRTFRKPPLTHPHSGPALSGGSSGALPCGILKILQVQSLNQRLASMGSCVLSPPRQGCCV